MNNKILNLNTIIITSIILVAALSRLIPNDLHNFSPILAMGLLGGALLKNRKMAFAIPLLAMLISDIFLGFHYMMPFVYGAIALSVMFGIILIKKINVGNILFSSIVSALTFFVVSNFGVWLVSGMYTLDFAGLINCYTMAIPFFRMTLISTLVFSTVFFGAYYLLGLKIPQLAKVENK